jgi:ATP-dependent protease HslVU (ClpYQ) peptidase subunit
MTVIAWDGRTLAADKQTTFGSVKAKTTKITRSKCGALMGAAGPTAACVEMMDWYEGGANPDSFPQHQRDVKISAALLVITKGKQIIHYDASPYPIGIEDKKFAIGDGEKFALAAMHCGKDAVQAVAVASFFSVYCGNGVDYLRLKG